MSESEPGPKVALRGPRPREDSVAPGMMRDLLPSEPTLRALVLLVEGQSVPAAEVSVPVYARGRDEELEATLAALDAHRNHHGTTIAYSVPSTPGQQQTLERAGFARAFDVSLRNLYLSIAPVSKALDGVSFGAMRNLARRAMQIRQKLIEVPLDDGWLGHAERVFEHRAQANLGFAVRRDLAYLKARFGDPAAGYRLLVLRRKAGVGADAYAIVRTFAYGSSRTCVQLVDHWSRNPDRRAIAWLLGELAVWGLAEKCDVLQGFAASGAPLDQVLVAAGCIRKKWTAPFMVKRLGPVPVAAARLQIDRVALRASDLSIY
jgi:hypothetical protein